MTSHAFVIGGTGMLRKSSLALAQEGDVTVIAKRWKRLKALREEVVGVNGRIHPISLNDQHTDHGYNR